MKITIVTGSVGIQGLSHDPSCQSIRQLQRMLSSLLQRAHSSPEGQNACEALYTLNLVH